MGKITRENIAAIPLFSGIDHDELFSLIRGCRVSSLSHGEYIFRHGEYGEDCGIVLSGGLCVDLPNRPVARVEDQILLNKGDLFGEIAVLSGYVRTADIAAVKSSEVLIIPKKRLLELLDRFPAFKERVDELYRIRVLSSQFRTTPLFIGLPEELLEKMTGKAALRCFGKGEVVFRQGDEADSFYLVRYGVLSVTESVPGGGSRTLAYIKAGHFFGERALMAESEKRIATVTAEERTELIRVSRSDFQHIIKSYPRIRSSLEKFIAKTQEKNAQIRQDEYMERTVSSVIDSGFILSRDLLVIDFTKCIHCNSCIEACRAVHVDHSRLVRKGIKLNNIILVVTSCRHCDDPTCMIECPTGAISRRATGEIYHSDSCVGCGRCSRNCPYGAISMIEASGECDKHNGSGFLSRYLKKAGKDVSDGITDADGRKTNKQRAVMCDMCRDHPVMACVHNCPTGAVRRIYPKEFFTDVIGA